MPEYKIHEVCKCRDLKPEDCGWMGPFVVIIDDHAYPFIGDIDAVIEHGGTALYHSKCGRACCSPLIEKWIENGKLPETRNIIKGTATEKK